MLDLPAVTVGVVIVDVNDVVVDDVIVDVFAVAAGCGDGAGIAIGAAGAVDGDDVCPALDDGRYCLVSSFVDLNCFGKWTTDKVILSEYFLIIHKLLIFGKWQNK